MFKVFISYTSNNPFYHVLRKSENCKRGKGGSCVYFLWLAISADLKMARGLVFGKTVFRRYASCMSTVKKKFVADVINDSEAIGLTAHVKGWIKGVRKFKDIVFVNVNDGSCFDSIQVIVPRTLLPNELSNGSSVCVTGKLKTQPNGKNEIFAETIEIIGGCDLTEGYPFTPGQKHPFDYSRQYLHFRPKLLFFSALLRARHSSTLAVHEYFRENNFVGIHTPIITSNDCEGAGETFMVQPTDDDLVNSMEKENQLRKDVFFNCGAFLTVSGQLHLEVISRSLPRVYTFNPTFRAENSNSRLHLSEFYMIEAEEAFIEGLPHVLLTMENLLKHLISNLLTHNSQDLSYILKNNQDDSKHHLLMLENILSKPFTVMSYSEAKAVIEKNMDQIEHAKNSTLNFTKEEELFLVSHNGNIPIFVVDWPKNLKPFYVKSCDRPDLVQAVDLLVPVVGELCGGSIREENYDKLCESLMRIGKLKELDWYLQLRKFGNVPTGGFGMGFERFLQFAMNISNIKDTIPFPRSPHSLQL